MEYNKGTKLKKLMKIDWNVKPEEAVKIQNKLRARIKLRRLGKPIHKIGGADASMNLFAPHGYAGFITLSYPDLAALDHSVKREKINFPYIPGLLSFREIPMMLSAWAQLKKKPDLIIVDGVGVAHPRRMGIATHLGLILNVPTIGVSKNALTGTYKEPGRKPGDISYLYDKNNKKEILGAVLRTKPNVKPVFVSPGHLITLEEAVDIVQKCMRKHRLPEPTRLAHNIVNEYRMRDQNLL